MAPEEYISNIKMSRIIGYRSRSYFIITMMEKKLKGWSRAMDPHTTSRPASKNPHDIIKYNELVIEVKSNVCNCIIKRFL